MSEPQTRENYLICGQALFVPFRFGFPELEATAAPEADIVTGFTSCPWRGVAPGTQPTAGPVTANAHLALVNTAAIVLMVSVPHQFQIKLKPDVLQAN